MFSFHRGRLFGREGGFTILQVMVASVIAIILMMAIFQLVAYTQKAQRGVTLNAEFENLITQTTMALAQNCTGNFKDRILTFPPGTALPFPVSKIAPQVLPNPIIVDSDTGIKASGDKAVLSTKVNLPSGLSIDGDFSLNAFSASEVTAENRYEYIGELVIAMTKDKERMLGSPKLRRTISLSIISEYDKVAGHYKIVFCTLGGPAPGPTTDPCEMLGGHYDPELKQCTGITLIAPVTIIKKPPSPMPTH